MDQLTFEVPGDLAREAVENTETHEEAERYVMDRVDAIRLVWPDDLDSGSTQVTKCPRREQRRSN